MFDNLTKLAKILGAVLGLLVSIKKSEQRKKFAYENFGEKKNISQIFHSMRSFLELQCSSDNSRFINTYQCFFTSNILFEEVQRGLGLLLGTIYIVFL